MSRNRKGVSSNLPGAHPTPPRTVKEAVVPSASANARAELLQCTMGAHARVQGRGGGSLWRRLPKYRAARIPAAGAPRPPALAGAHAKARKRQLKAAPLHIFSNFLKLRKTWHGSPFKHHYVFDTMRNHVRHMRPLTETVSEGTWPLLGGTRLR